MADEIITRQELVDAKIDAKDLGECIHGNETGIVNPRLGNPYPTLPAAVQKVMESGGFEPFPTEANLLASTPTVSPKAAKAMDTKKVWYWGKYSEDETVDSWHDTGLSELDQANLYTDNLFTTVDNLYKSALILEKTYVDVTTNTVENNDKTTAVSIHLKPNSTYKLYSPTYPEFAVRVWFSNKEIPSGVLDKPAVTNLADGYQQFSTPASDVYLIYNIIVPSQFYDSSKTLIVKDITNRQLNTKKIIPNTFDYGLITDFDRTLGISRNSYSLLNDAIHFPNRYINTADNVVMSAPATYSIAWKLSAGDYFIYAPGKTTDHVLAFANNLSLGSVLSRINLKQTEEFDLYQFTLPNDCFVMINTLVLGIDILHTLNLSKSKNITKQRVQTIGDNLIEAATLKDAETIGEALPTKALDGLYINAVDHVILGYANTRSRICPVMAGKTYYIYSPIWNTDYVVWGYILSQTPDRLSKVEEFSLTDTEFNNVKSFVVPDDGKQRFLMINTIIQTAMNIDSTFKLCVDNYSHEPEMTSINNLGLADVWLRDQINQFLKGPLSGKKWVAIGDSITEHNFRTNKNYHDYIREIVSNLTVYNYGISGTGYKDRYDVADTITENPDIITVFWGTNDWDFANIPLGVFLDSTTDTISGRINRALSKLIAKFPTALLSVFSPLPRADNWGSNAANNANGYTLEQLVELIKKYAAHFSLPFLDLYHSSNLPVWDAEGNRYYFTAPNLPEPDGLHPNDNGHKVLARKVKAFLESQV